MAFEGCSCPLSKVGLGAGLTGIIGQSRNAAITNAAFSSSITFTVDELIVQTALGGVQYKLANLNLSSSLSVVGAGGVDIAGTVPTNGYMAKYAIYNPLTGAKSSLLQLCTSAKSSEVYTGTAMPAGYTASALVAVWPIISGQFAIGYLRGRKVTRPMGTAINTSTPYASNISLAGTVPPNAVKCWGNMWANSGGSGGSTTVTISTDSTGAGFKQAYMGNIPGGGDMSFELTIATPQTAYSSFTNSNSGTPNANITITDYEF